MRSRLLVLLSSCPPCWKWCLLRHPFLPPAPLPPPYDTFSFGFWSILDARSVFGKRKRRFGKTDEQVATR